MEQIEFPQDFSEFLKLLNDHSVEYLLVGGFAVAIHGYPRATSDMDVWVSRSLANANSFYFSHSWTQNSRRLTFSGARTRVRTIQTASATQRTTMIRPSSALRLRFAPLTGMFGISK